MCEEGGGSRREGKSEKGSIHSRNDAKRHGNRKTSGELLSFDGGGWLLNYPAPPFLARFYESGFALLGTDTENG